MARSELLVSLAIASLNDDFKGAQSLVEAIAAEEAHKGHSHVAARLRSVLQASQLSSESQRLPNREFGRDYSAQRGVLVRPATRALSEIQLGEVNRRTLDELVIEQKQARVLRAVGLEPRHRLLLTGAPGTGKTSLGEAIAAELAVPFRVAQYEEIIGSYLGETSSRLHAVFSDAAQGPSVLFLDEFDTLAKERGDLHDTGEVKRVVSTLLLQIDALPSHVLVIAATNHPELLDRAAWRRFQVRLEMPMPNETDRARFATDIAGRIGLVSIQGVINQSRERDELSYAGVEELVLSARRSEVLAPYSR